MKESYTVTHCEFCDKMIDLRYIEERFKANEIYINCESHIKKQMRSILGKNSDEKINIAGYYCHIVCLRNKIENILEDENN